MSNIYKQSLNRKQQQFFPPSLDEYVNEDNQVRAIEDYVELLDVIALDFKKSALLSRNDVVVCRINTKLSKGSVQCLIMSFLRFL